MLPRLAVNAGCRVAVATGRRPAQQVDVVDVMQQRREPLLPVPSGGLTYAIQRGANVPGSVSGRRDVPSAFPLASPASLRRLRGWFRSVVRRLLGTTELSDFPWSCIIGVSLGLPDTAAPGS